MPFHLRPQDRVVFYGDSITEQQLYTVYVETFVRTRFPTLELRFHNRGWGGDTAWGQTEGGPVELRTKRDVAPLEPTVLTAMMGMNDGGYMPYSPSTHKNLAREYERMVSNLVAAAPAARVTLIRTSPWDQYTTEPSGSYPGDPFPPKGYNDALLEYGTIVEETAKKYKFGYVDFNLPMVDVMSKARLANLPQSNEIVPDWIHPGPAGHLIMAGELLKAWRAPRVVSTLVIDAVGNNVTECQGAKVEGVENLSWTQTDDALPFCVLPDDPTVALVLENCDFTDSLNRQTLEVHGLGPGVYKLLVDGEQIGSYSAEALGKGINLATLDTPMRRQSHEVLDFVAKRSMLEVTRWRQIEVKFPGMDAASEASEALTRMENAMLAAGIEAAKPKPHRFELVAP